MTNDKKSPLSVPLSINGSIKTTNFVAFTIDINHLYLKNLSIKWFVTVNFK